MTSAVKTTAVETRDLSAEVTEVSASVERLRTQQLRAEVLLSAAIAEEQRVLDKLKTEFNVDSPEAAQLLLDELDVQVAEELNLIRSKLAEIESL